MPQTDYTVLQERLLLSRFRAVAFAALGAGIPRTTLDAALDVAELADDQARAAALRPVRLVTETAAPPAGTPPPPAYS